MPHRFRDRRMFRRVARLTCTALALHQLAPAQAPAPPPNVITVNPPVTIRGSSFDVNVMAAPPGATKVVVTLDGRPLPAPAFDPKFPQTLHLTIPDETDPTSPSFVPLGTHRLSVSFDGRWFTAGSTLTVVRPEQSMPVLRDVAPVEIAPRQSERILNLTGNHFLTTPPEDNQIMLGGLPLPVAWDGCNDHTKWQKDKRSLAHGRVDPSGTRITLCNFPVSGGRSPDVQVLQGSVHSEPLTLHLPPWPKSAIVAASVAVNLCSLVLVLFLTHFVRRYRIGNSRYGTFRILFLDPETNTYSLSKYQFYMWTGAAVFTYAYLAISRIFVQGESLPDIPSTLPAIIGLGAGTAIGSQLLTSIRGPKGGGQEKPSLGDFVTTGGVAAADRVQMFVWTTLGVCGFCLATLRADPWSITSLPQVGTGLMYLMGLSSVGYLGGKLARKPGPLLSEISITPGRADDGRAPTKDLISAPDVSEPIAAARQVVLQAQSVLGKATSTAASPAFAAAGDALKALQSSIAASSAGGPTTLETVAANATVADAAARAAADAFEHTAIDDAATTRDASLFAEVAQQCAAAAQDLATGAAQATGIAQAATANAPSEAPHLRTIDIRGRNLSTDATFEINDINLPFRMLVPENGVKGPHLVAPEDDAGLANMARELQLVIAPDTLGQADRTSYDLWFAYAVSTLKLSIINPDGQRSEISFNLPPGTSQTKG